MKPLTEQEVQATFQKLGLATEVERAKFTQFAECQDWQGVPFIDCRSPSPEKTDAQLAQPTSRDQEHR